MLSWISVNIKEADFFMRAMFALKTSFICVSCCIISIDDKKIIIFSAKLFDQFLKSFYFPKSGYLEKKNS